mmetsp:Transcript_30559/g.63041  ORF Transcript_30559/g.63041 Transcript_30559/m.63041 type:complete len:140 (+) Transcript_30559:167-586(+)
MVQKEKASKPNHMINLYNNIQKHNSSCFFPPELMSAVREAATADACTSPTSDKDNDLGMAYENTVAKVAEFMLKRVSQPMAEKKKEKKMTSEETYTISLLGLCEFFEIEPKGLLEFSLTKLYCICFSPIICRRYSCMGL